MSKDVSHTVGQLSSKALLPTNLELSEFGPVSIVNSYDSILNASTFKDSVYTGFDIDPSRALIKSLSEYFERKAMVQEARLNSGLVKRYGSDGLAAYPVYGNPLKAKGQSRQNAIFEATERYSWVNWWHDHTKKFSIENRTADTPESVEKAIFKELEKVIEFTRIELVTINVFIPDLNVESVVSIYILMSKNKGFICGSGCGYLANRESVKFKALCEMFRHCLGYSRLVKNKVFPESVYEERLLLYGNGGTSASKAVESRLSIHGEKSIEPPELAWDYAVDHKFKEYFSVHRALFKGHPDFLKNSSDGFYL